MPVLLLGSNAFGWVDRATCKQGTAPALGAALMAAWSRLQVRGRAFPSVCCGLLALSPCQRWQRWQGRRLLAMAVQGLMLCGRCTVTVLVPQAAGGPAALGGMADVELACVRGLRVAVDLMSSQGLGPVPMALPPGGPSPLAARATMQVRVFFRRFAFLGP